jgi:outer membrane immunogenic protein
VQQATTWSGVYFGAHSGYAWSTYENTYVAGGPNNFWELDSDSMLAGVQIGLQHQFGAFVLGIEGNLSSAVMQRDNAAQCPNPATICQGVFTDVLTIGPRLGWAMGKYMPYLTAGYGSAAFDHTVVVKATSTQSRQAHDRVDGWYIGAGVDMALAAGWTVGLEYRHYEFSDFTSERHFVGGPVDPGDRANVDTTLDTFAVRLSWKLDRLPAVAPAPMK